MSFPGKFIEIHEDVPAHVPQEAPIKVPVPELVPVKR